MDVNDPRNWPANTPVRVIKLAACRDAGAPASAWEEWKRGVLNDGASLPVQYELQGSLIAPMEVGKPILVKRTHRKGVEADGFFYSTPVRQFGNGHAITLNSVYLISKEEEISYA